MLDPEFETDNLVPEPTSLHTEREQDRMEILVVLLKLSATGFFFRGDMPKIRKKERPTHSNLGGSPDNVVKFYYDKIVHNDL